MLSNLYVYCTTSLTYFYLGWVLFSVLQWFFALITKYNMPSKHLIHLLIIFYPILRPSISVKSIGQKSAYLSFFGFSVYQCCNELSNIYEWIYISRHISKLTFKNLIVCLGSKKHCVWTLTLEILRMSFEFK